MMIGSPPPAPEDRVFFSTGLHWIVLVRSLLLALVGWTLQQQSMHEVFTHLVLPDLAWWWDELSLESVRSTGMDLDTLLSTAASVLALLTLLTSFLRSRYTRFLVTSTRVVVRHGILRSRDEPVPYQCLDGVSVSKGVFGRLFGYGTVKVAGPGVRAKWRRVARPDALRRAAEARLTAWLCRDLGGTAVARRPASL